MIGLAVYLNGKKLTVAGTEDLSVLNAIVNAVGPLGRDTKKLGKGDRTPDLFLQVGGLTGRKNGVQDEHLKWVRHRPLRVGDKISVRIVRITKADAHNDATPKVKIDEKKLMRQVQQKMKASARKKRTSR
jgi:hypothetical protein